MEEITRKEKILIGLIVLLGIVISVLKLKPDFRKKPLEIEKEIGIEERVTEGDDEDKEVKSVIMVHISGAVKNPGLIELDIENSRLKNAIDLCGGLLDDADENKINLAKKLSDEDRVHVPLIGENTEVEIMEMNNGSEKGKVNINNCSKEELMTLPGIGDITSEKIIDYREDNRFNSIEDLMMVSGIGEKKFEAVKDVITVN